MRISKMVMTGAVAAVAVAGSANAAFVTYVLDSFGTSSSNQLAVNATRTGSDLSTGFDWTNWGGTSTKVIAGSAPAAPGQPPQSYVFATAVQSGGTVTMGVDTTGAQAPSNTISVNAGGNAAVSYRYGATSTGSAVFNLSGKGDFFYFDGLVNDPSNGKWQISVSNGATDFRAIVSDVGTLVNGRWHVAFSQLTDGANSWTDFANVRRVFLGLRPSSGITNSSISGSMTEFGIIPAPGAIALLGAAGLVGGARRRR